MGGKAKLFGLLNTSGKWLLPSLSEPFVAAEAKLKRYFSFAVAGANRSEGEGERLLYTSVQKPRNISYAPSPQLGLGLGPVLSHFNRFWTWSVGHDTNFVSRKLVL